MTVTKTYLYDRATPYYIGVSGDTKPVAAPIGALFLETNTMHEFVQSTTSGWVQKQTFTT